MIYGKLNGGLLEQAPYHMVKNKVDYCGYNFDSNRDMLLADGYKPVETLNDKSGYHDCDGTFSFVFEEEDDKIVEKAVFKKYSDEEKAQQVREQRDRLLQQTDKLMVSDYPIAAEDAAAPAAGKAGIILSRGMFVDYSPADNPLWVRSPGPSVLVIWEKSNA